MKISFNNIVVCQNRISSVIARRPQADAAISNRSNVRDCHGLSGLAMTTHRIILDGVIDLTRNFAELEKYTYQRR